MTSSTPQETVCVTGASLSGKTDALIAQASLWVAGTQQPEDFLFFCASSVTESEIQHRLIAAELVGTVTTPYHYALRILDDHEARAFTKRNPRVLSPHQEAVFFEDLKTSGVKTRRLREMWAFFLCGWANLDDDDQSWIQTTEEQAQLDLAQDILTFENAMLAGEVVNLAVHVLRALPQLRERYGASLVMADDYLLMSRASQELVNLLAFNKLAVAGNPEPEPAAFEPYPWSHGLDDFCVRYPNTRLCRLPEPSSKAESTWIAATDLSQEMAVIAKTVTEALDDGITPDGIAVVGTNHTWRANVLRALRSCGIPAEELKLPRQHPLSRTVSEVDEDDRIRLLESLAANPHDSCLWRQYLSLDDALGRSAAMSELRGIALPQGLTLAEALEHLSDNALEGMSPNDPFAASLLGPYRKALAYIECPSSDANGPVSCQPGEQPSKFLCDDWSAKPDEHSSSAVARVVTGEGVSQAVAIAKPEDLFGRRFSLVIFGGFVNGFIPSRALCDSGVVVGDARKRAEKSDRAAIQCAISRATNRVVFTGFESCPLEVAEQLKLHIARIRLQGGERICTIEPSVYLADMDIRKGFEGGLG